QSCESLSSQSVQLLNRKENLPVHHKLQLFKTEWRIAGLLHAAAHFLFIQGPLLSSLYALLRLYSKRNASAAHGQHCRAVQGQHEFSADLLLPVRKDIGFIQLPDELLIPDPAHNSSSPETGSLRHKKSDRASLSYRAAQSMVFLSLPGLQDISLMQFCECGSTDFSSPLLRHSHCVHPSVVRTVQGKHFSSIMPLVISCMRSASVVQIHKHLPVFRTDRELLLSSVQIQICIFSVHCGNCRHILRTLHPPLDLKRIDAGFHKLRDQLQGAYILQAQKILL